MAAEPVHMPVRSRNAPVAHRDGHLVQRFGQQRPEVPVGVGAVHVRPRIAFDDMVQVRKFQRIAQEKDRRVVPHQVPVPLVRVEFDRETADVALRVGSPRSPATVEKRTKQSVFFPTSAKIEARVYFVMSCVTVKVP